MHLTYFAVGLKTLCVPSDGVAIDVHYRYLRHSRLYFLFLLFVANHLTRQDGEGIRICVK